MTKEHRPNTNTPPDEDSVFSRLMNTRVAQVDRMPDQVGAVIVFKRGITETDAKIMLATLSDSLQSAELNAFNPAYGSPVFWIP